ncbi:MAG: hypothetical protein ACO2OZ_11675 [Acidilobaceae archaeon]
MWPRRGRPESYHTCVSLTSDAVEEVKPIEPGPGSAGPLNPLSKVPEVKIWCSFREIVYARNEYVEVSEDELYGRINNLALEDFFESGGRNSCGIVKE